MFLASASEYDEFLREDHTINRLDESLKVFQTLINYKHFQGVEFILFLNKYDLLKEKIMHVNIKNYCKDFAGNPSSIGDIEKYLIGKFSSLKTGSEAPENKQQQVTGGSVSKSNNKLHPNNKIRNASQFDEIIRHRPLSANSARDSPDGERYIYSHFTTAIDTTNIKTIFEMVRLMIFEKNCKAIMLN